MVVSNRRSARSRADDSGAARLSLIERIAMFAGLVAGALSRRLGLGDGDQISGRVMLVIAPRIGRHLAAGRTVTLVSMTNGKSSTVAMLRAALNASGMEVASNLHGANMLPGLVSALARQRLAPHAVLETDEGVLPAAIAAFAPRLIVLGELSRDQLDRHHEVAKIAAKWREAFHGTDARFVAPVGDVNVGWSVEGQDVVWVDVESFSTLDGVACPRCGNLRSTKESIGEWRCTCDVDVPDASIVQRGNTLVVDGEKFEVSPALHGRWQRANQAMAVATARELGVPVADAIAATDSVASVGERSPQLPTPSGRDATLVLAKNPAGWAALIEDLCDRDVDIVFVQNDNAADGRDPSWIWDVDFERLAPRHVVASGTRALDVAVRTQTAGLDVVAIEPDPRRAVEIADRGRELVVAASYTAFFDLARSRHR